MGRLFRIIAVLAALAGISALAYLALPLLRGTTSPGVPEPTTLKQFSPDREVTTADLQKLSWQQINPLVAAIGADPERINRVRQLGAELASPPTTYLLALLALSQQQPETALALLDELNTPDIPALFLYAPYRLHQGLKPDTPNPYLPLLRQAVEQQAVPELIRARLLAVDGKLAQALNNYLRTDPAQWVGYDLEAMRRISSHQGLRADLRRMIAGALASGRVRPTIAPSLQGISRRPTNRFDMDLFRQNLRRSVAEQSPEGKIAIESARRLLEERQLFLQRKYAALIERYHETDQTSVSTETLVLLFLSAVSAAERVEIDRWGQELKRRHNDLEVRNWVTELSDSVK